MATGLAGVAARIMQKSDADSRPEIFKEADPPTSRASRRVVLFVGLLLRRRDEALYAEVADPHPQATQDLSALPVRTAIPCGQELPPLLHLHQGQFPQVQANAPHITVQCALCPPHYSR
jgi:hypothetical protein